MPTYLFIYLFISCTFAELYPNF